jgi:cell division protein FtsW (lipid II flippase)
MTVGLMPITGLTLPLVSYGGSSLVVSMTALGLLNNVGRCRPFGVAREVHKRPLLAWALPAGSR